MNENLLSVLFSLIIIILFSLNFNKSWSDRTYEKLLGSKKPWFWFKVFNIEVTKDNYLKFSKGLSIFVIVIMIISIILSFWNN